MRSARFRFALTVVAAVAWMPVAHAQDPGQPAPPAGEGYPPAAPAEVPPPPPVAEPVPPPPPPPPPPHRVVQQAPVEAPPSEEGENDLDPDRRPVGIGYAGVSQIPITATVNVTAPAIGLRYWASKKTGLDIALGFGWADGSTEIAGVSTDANAVWGLVLQGGVPFALATHRHVSFQLIPYALFAYGATKTGATGVGAISTDLSGTRFDLGVRSGLEIFWGFIGLPQLSLSATVGAAFQLRNITSDMGGMFGKMSATTYSITTTVQNNPWDIFTGNVAARYYF
jgi:hypothetical protein